MPTITELRRQADKLELDAVQKRQVADSTRGEAMRSDETDPQSIAMMNQSVQFDREAAKLEEEASQIRDQIARQETEAAQLEDEKRRIEADYQAKIIEIDNKITNLRGSVF